MTDFHTHVLPQIDDGSKSVVESRQMLIRLRRQGVTTVVASPHYYRYRETIPEFIERRNISLENLLSVYGQTNTPRIIPGAEAAFFMDMSREPDTPSLCIEGTNKLLLEMPFTAWSGSVINEVYQLIALCDITPIIAHIERYIDGNQNAEALDLLISFGAIIQSNAEYFLNHKTRRKAFSMLDSGKIHIFGSDCHNLSDRVPNMSDLRSLLERKLTPEKLKELEITEKQVLSQLPDMR